SEGASITPEVPDKSTYIFKTSSERTGITPGVLDEVKGSSEAKVDSVIDWGSENEIEKQDDDDDDRSIDIENINDDDEETYDEYVDDDDYMHID
ncbi:hypothetical protein Tco_0507322, partial [Tanacetum coccineum]